ncbi:MAG: hypothetical protein Fur0042_26490 [Cyanophyceae cyanobacterium]
MSTPKPFLSWLAVGALASLPALASVALSEFRTTPSQSVALVSRPINLNPEPAILTQETASGVAMGDRLKDDDWDDWDNDPVIQITGRVVRFGERDENEWIVEANGRRYRVDAGPRWWRDLPVAIGDQLTIEGELDDGELDAFWVELADGERVEMRGRSGPPPWAGERRWR